MLLRNTLPAVIATAVLVVGLACNSDLESYSCSDNSDCTNGNEIGVCEENALCSFIDSSCSEGGRRYGAASGELSNLCVGAPDAGAADAALADAALADSGPPDADLSPDAAPPDAGVPDATPCDVTVTTNITDKPSALNKLRISADSQVLGECQATAAPGGTAQDVFESCDFCVPSGTLVSVTAIPAFNLESFIQSCGALCSSNACSFTATMDCTVSALFTELLLER